MTLAAEHCEACRAGAPRVSDDELADLIKAIPDWQPVTRESTLQLQRSFKFKTFRDALDFTNQVGELAEREGHHPEIVTEWGKTTVTWWTHKIGGLHRNDFICAAKTDSLLTG
ncbi:4a-hydroxytetrahydrobiopterin dehydratase [Saccharospirillum impatiens]|uniref:4a-hydroxytetrahydrobiopterin dehydratase n=1 Tax=Saccharospirillum impatiens TaxID=169438 RepID=UPI0004019200|nr:4a-hydroxytetrahydrobiopterin dehydratase [Saccharospirillum impatiens]